MQDCEKYDIMINARVDGTLNKKDARELEKHLAACADCRKYLQLLEDMKEALREDLPDPPETLLPGIMAGIREERRRKLRFGAFGRWTAIAAVLFVAVFGVVKLSGSGVMKSAAPEAADAQINYTAATGGAATEAEGAAAQDGAWLEESKYAVARSATAAPTAYVGEEAVNGTAANGAGDSGLFDDVDSAAEPAEAPSSVYTASSLRGYDLGQAALAGGDYRGVCVFYDDLPEALSPGHWQTMIPEDGERARWQLTAEELDELENSAEWNEFYYGDLNADRGLVIVIAGEEE